MPWQVIVFAFCGNNDAELPNKILWLGKNLTKQPFTKFPFITRKSKKWSPTSPSQRIWFYGGLENFHLLGTANQSLESKMLLVPFLDHNVVHSPFICSTLENKFFFTDFHFRYTHKKITLINTLYFQSSNPKGPLWVVGYAKCINKYIAESKVFVGFQYGPDKGARVCSSN